MHSAGVNFLDVRAYKSVSTAFDMCIVPNSSESKFFKCTRTTLVIFFFLSWEEQFYQYLFMFQRLMYTWTVSLYSVVVTDLLLTYMDSLN